jgi:hypothetical protein
MLNIKKILLPVDIPIASLGVIHQAATLARHFNSEIAMLHVVTEVSHAAGVPKDSGELAGTCSRKSSESLRNRKTSLSGPSLTALPFGAWSAKATRLGQLCE